MMKRHSTKTGILLIGGLLLGGCQWLCKESPKYKLFQVQTRNLVKYIEANGSIETRNTIDVYSPVPGRVEKLFVREGDMVKAKQTLGLVSSDQRTLFLDLAASKGQAEVEYWKQQLKLTPITAPSDGKLITLQLEVDGRASGIVAQISKGEIIRANVDEADLPHTRLGQPVVILFDVAPDKKLRGTLDEIAQVSKMVNNVNVYQVEVSLPPAAKLKELPFEVKIGMSVTLNFAVKEKRGALALPLAAVDGRSDGSVTLHKSDGSAAKVRLGAIYGTWVEVVSGLEPGDQVKVPRVRIGASKARQSPLLKRE